MSEIKNALITRTCLDTERGLTAWIHLDYGGLSQAFGGYMLYGSLEKDKRNYGGHFIKRCIEIGGVGEWEKLPGKTIRVKIEDGLARSIGHIIKDNWFCPQEDFARFQ